ncbi:glycosyltransferase family 2 protein [Mixta mediterraneensis]|uniref:glycosyltransferase family 2 protein n=1 Tax=Mixta mediterraneensis TaxID=2758443 RepID=UPI001876CC1F|nr:glycosyltransferase family 2 protein [Mixta mediterraneensis]MBE5252426.1 glycosyltransferase family 2 protein [Mixta mediterraneensis]
MNNFLQTNVKANVKNSELGTISILLGTYNGELYIQQQLDSIRAQTYKDWVLYVSDDGSVDRTLGIINDFAKEFPAGKVKVLKGPQKGFAQNFFSLLRNNSIHSPYYAFCDQDDIWLDTKLEIAIKSLKRNCTGKKPYQLYGSRTTLIDERGKYLGDSPLFQRELSVKNALIQSYAGGNTMVFNHDIKRLFENIEGNLNVISHDWLLYITVAALNGVIIYDKQSYMLYRQHDNNLVGSNKGLLSKVERFKKIYSGEYKAWNKNNHEILEVISSNIDDVNNEVIRLYYRKSDSLVERAHNFLKSGVYRQAKYETLFFFLMAVLGKLN